MSVKDMKVNEKTPPESRPGSMSSQESPSTKNESQDEEANFVSEEELDIKKAPYSVYGTWHKTFYAVIVCISALMSPVTAAVLFPISNPLTQALGVTREKVNLLVTYYMIVQGLSPMLFAGVADVVGRRWIYIVTMLVFIFMSVGIGETTDYNAISALRALQSLGASPTIAIGAGCIGDLFLPKDRGLFMGLFLISATTGPALGPLLAAALADRWPWESVFYCLACLGAFVLLMVAVCLPETHRPIVWNGSVRPSLPLRSGWSLIKQALRGGKDEFKYDRVPPGAAPKRGGWRNVKPWLAFEILSKNFQLGCILSTFATLNALFYSLQITIDEFFYKENSSDKYGLTLVQTGLCFLPLGAGNLVSAFVSGRFLNWSFRHEIRKIQIAHGDDPELNKKIEEKYTSATPNDLRDFPLESARLRLIPLDIMLMALPTIAYAWCVQKEVHMAAPLVLLFIIGYGQTAITNCITTYSVDISLSSASSSAAANLVRCLFGAACTGFVHPMLDKIGPGWTLTFFAFLLMLTLPVILAQFKWGMKWRQQRIDKELEKKRKAEEEKKLQEQDAEK